MTSQSEHSSSVVSTDDSIFDKQTDISSLGNSSIASQSHAKTRAKPAPSRLHTIGIDPNLLIGKVLTHVRRSRNHPNLTLEFSDGNCYQILVDGYDPMHRGVPRVLETDELLSPIFAPRDGHTAVELYVTDCKMIRLTDKALDRRQSEERWDQSHLAIAFKFGEERRWHCVWAALDEYDEQRGTSVFRSYDDVYLERRTRHESNSFNRRRKPGPHARHGRHASVSGCAFGGAWS